MRWIITDPRGVTDALADKAAPGPSRLSAIAAGGVLTPTQRLDIYAEAYFSRLCESLEDDYARVRALVGEDAFRGLVAEYLAAHPSRSFTVAHAGERFAAFLAVHELNEDLPWLKELASLEWAKLAALSATDDAGLEFARFAALTAEDWSGATLSLQASCRLLALEYAIGLEGSEEGTATVFEKRQTWLLVNRRDFRACVRPLERAAFEVLAEIGDGVTLAALCERLERASSEPLPLGEWFRDWASSGVLKITLPA